MDTAQPSHSFVREDREDREREVRFGSFARAILTAGEDAFTRLIEPGPAKPDAPFWKGVSVSSEERSGVSLGALKLRCSLAIPRVGR